MKKEFFKVLFNNGTSIEIDEVTDFDIQEGIAIFKMASEEKGGDPGFFYAPMANVKLICRNADTE